MKYMINDKVVLSRPPEGPLADHMSSFTGWVSEQGYAASSLWQRVHLAACFSSWLGKRGIRLRSVSSEHPAQYLRYRERRVRPTRSDVAALRQLLDFLRRESLIPAAQEPSRRITPVARCLHGFERLLASRARLSQCDHPQLLAVYQ